MPVQSFQEVATKSSLPVQSFREVATKSVTIEAPQTLLSARVVSDGIGDFMRVTVAKFKPEADGQKAMNDVMENGLANSFIGLPGAKFIGSFVSTTGQHSVSTAIYDCPEACEASSALAAKGWGQLAESLDGAPSVYKGPVEFIYRGPLKLKGEHVACRVTVMPLKPGTKSEVLRLLNSQVPVLKDELFSQLIDMRGFFNGEDSLVLVSRWRKMTPLFEAWPKQKEFFAPLLPHLSGKPSRIFGTYLFSSPKIEFVKKPAVKKTGCC